MHPLSIKTLNVGNTAAIGKLESAHAFGIAVAERKTFILLQTDANLSFNLLARALYLGVFGYWRMFSTHGPLVLAQRT